MKMLKQMMISALLLGSVFVGKGFAGEIKKCANIQIKNLYVEGARDDGLYGKDAANKIVITIAEACDGFTNFYVPLNEPAYGAMLTVILNAKNTTSNMSFWYDIDSGLSNISNWREIDLVGID
ncbi:MAG: hypothetical protein OCC49_13750 [Fibrobacterales bacterium]